MSLEAAIGRIDQILTLRAQLLDPAAALATAGTGTTAGGSASAASSFASMLTAAQGNALTGSGNALTGSGNALTGSGELTGLTDPISSGAMDTLASLDATGTTPTTGAAGVAGGPEPAAVQAMVEKANSLLGKPYVWGGGHGDFGPQSGYDCSGFVSAVLHAGGFLSAPQDTQTLPDQPGIENGPGQYVTIYDRTDAGSGEDHVIIDLAGQFYESGGQHGAWGGGGGVEKIDRPSASYLASFNRVLHPAGL
jgi:cell wall-associated NlpC family hydrolase